MALHTAQRSGMEVAAALDALYPQMTAAASKLKAESKVPADVKARFDALNRQFDTVRVKFGVPAVAAGRGGGGGRGGADASNVLARLSALKVGIAGMWEPPTAASTKQSADARLALQQAIAEANLVLSKASAMSESLKAYEIALAVPPVGKAR